MKKIIVLILMSILVLASCYEESSDTPEHCDEEVRIFYNHVVGDCNLSTKDRKKLTCSGLRGKSSPTYDKCIENIKKLSCERANEIETNEDFKTVDGCMNYEVIKRTRKVICAQHQENYCRQIFHDCGKDALYSACKSPSYNGSEEAPQVEFNKGEIAIYCKDTVNGDDVVVGLAPEESLCYHEIDCSNVQELDFRDDSWKSYCE